MQLQAPRREGPFQGEQSACSESPLLTNVSWAKPFQTWWYFHLMSLLPGTGAVATVDLCEGTSACWVGGRLLTRGCLFQFSSPCPPACLTTVPASRWVLSARQHQVVESVTGRGRGPRTSRPARSIGHDNPQPLVSTNGGWTGAQWSQGMSLENDPGQPHLLGGWRALDVERVVGLLLLPRFSTLQRKDSGCASGNAWTMSPRVPHVWATSQQQALGGGWDPSAL